MKAFFTFLAVFLAIAGPARPMELRAPTEAVILTVGGAIAVTNYGDTAVFDRPMLEDLGGRRYRHLNGLDQRGFGVRRHKAFNSGRIARRYGRDIRQLCA